MHVLQVVPAIHPVYGGVSTAVLQLCQALQQSGCQVTIATTNAAGEAGENWNVPLGVPTSYEGIPTIYFNRSSRFKVSPSLTAWLWQNVQQFDLIHLHAVFSYPTLAGAWAAQGQKVPYILSPHGMLDRRDLKKKARAKKIYGLLEQWALRDCRAVHFTCNEEATRSRKTPGQAVIIPLGVLPAPPHQRTGALHQRLGLDPKVPLILFLARWDPKKGLDRLLPALTMVESPFHLLLAGGDHSSYAQEVKAQISRLGLAAQISCPGFLQGAERELFLTESDLFVMPSYYENFGLAAVEALAWGLPLIVTKGVYIWPELVAGGAALVVEEKPEDLALGLEKLLKNSALRQTLGEYGKALAQTRYDWHSVAQQTIELYKKSIARGG